MWHSSCALALAAEVPVDPDGGPPDPLSEVHLPLRRGVEGAEVPQDPTGGARSEPPLPLAADGEVARDPDGVPSRPRSELPLRVGAEDDEERWAALDLRATRATRAGLVLGPSGGVLLGAGIAASRSRVVLDDPVLGELWRPTPDGLLAGTF